MKIANFATLSLMLALGTCTAQQEASIQAAAVLSCNAAAVAAAATVAITSDVNASKQTQTDAGKAQKVTTDACAALTKLPSIVVAPTPAAP